MSETVRIEVEHEPRRDGHVEQAPPFVFRIRRRPARPTVNPFVELGVDWVLSCDDLDTDAHRAGPAV